MPSRDSEEQPEVSSRGIFVGPGSEIHDKGKQVMSAYLEIVFLGQLRECLRDGSCQISVEDAKARKDKADVSNVGRVICLHICTHVLCHRTASLHVIV